MLCGTGTELNIDEIRLLTASELAGSKRNKKTCRKEEKILNERKEITT